MCGPSAAGKTSVKRELLNQNLDLRCPISTTTRKPRQNEEDGVDYNFITEEEYEVISSEGEIVVEFRNLKNDSIYIYRKSDVEDLLAQNFRVLMDVEISALDQARNAYPDAKPFMVFADYKTRHRRLFQERPGEDAHECLLRLEEGEKEIAIAKEMKIPLINNADGEVYNTVCLINSYIRTGEFCPYLQSAFAL